MYELIVVTDGEASSNKVKAVEKDVNDLVKILGGQVNETDRWGKKELVYKLGKSATGNFTVYTIDLNSEGTRELTLKLNLNEDVLRYLLVKAGKSGKENLIVKKSSNKKKGKKV